MRKKIILAAALSLCMPVLPALAEGDNGSKAIEENVAVGQVTGVVKDVHGEPIIGASIVEKGTHNAAVTDVDGRFTLKLEGKGSDIQVSYVGFTSQTIKSARQDGYNIAGRPTFSSGTGRGGLSEHPQDRHRGCRGKCQGWRAQYIHQQHRREP